MHKLILAFFLSAACLAGMAQSTSLKGKIGKYSIEMSLEEDHEGRSGIKGKYRYKGKTAYLTLEGSMHGNSLLYLEESWEGKQTGSFYLEKESQRKWSGKWIGNNKVFEAVLNVVEGDLDELWPYDLEKAASKVSDDITGTYIAENYFLNEMWFSDENPSLEMGFNGGVVTVLEKGPDKVQIEFELVCGPTYHIAYFVGEATKAGPNKYVFNTKIDYGDDNCHLEFEFKPGEILINQLSSGMDCGFGARAYAEGSFTKVNDKALEAENLSIDAAYGE